MRIKKNQASKSKLKSTKSRGVRVRTAIKAGAKEGSVAPQQ